LRATNSVTDSCTAHVFDIHEKQQIMTIAYYNGGVRVVDISNLVGISLGQESLEGQGMKQIGFYRFQNTDAWSAKTPKINSNGDFYLYGNDIARGLDVYRFDASAETSQSQGVWMSPAEAEQALASRSRVELNERTAFFCLRPQQ
jgi:hypothetical protein